MFIRRAVTLSLATLAASTAMPVLAQETTQSLEEILVTAQRREENIQSVPVSVAVLGGEKLSVVAGGTQDIRSLSARVPSLIIESSFGRTFPRFYIRGLGNTDFDLNASQPVSLVYDDVVLENPILKGFPVFDLERVEVLRGPQGTLFGRNTPAGIVKFESVKPDAEPSGYARLSYGRFNALNVEAAAGGALSEKITARVSGAYKRQDDWVDNLRTPAKNDLEGFEEFAARLQLQLQATEALTVRLTGQLRKLDGTARVFRANSIRPGTNELVTASNGASPTFSDFKRGEVSQDGINFSKLNTYNLTGTVAYDFGEATLTSVTAYWNGNSRGRGDIDGGFGASFLPSMGPGFIPFPAQSEDAVPSLDQFTQEIRIAKNDWTGFGYQVGVFYFDEALDIESISYPAPQSTTPDIFVTQRQDSRAWGLFGSASYDVTEQFTVQAGLRYNDDKRDIKVIRTIGFLGPLNTTAKVSDSTVTGDISATFKPSEDLTFYAKASRGYRAPSIQGRVLFGNDVSTAKSEKINSFEAGLKSTFADGRARFNLTGFAYRVNDLQLTAVGGTTNFARLVNADKVDGYGFEAELEARPIPELTLTAGLSLNDTEIKDSSLFITGCGGGCTVTDPQRPGSPGVFSINGNSLPQAAKWIANWTARYGLPVGADGEIFVFTDWAYRSEVNFLLYESREFNDDHLLEGGLRAGYLGRGGQYELAAFVRNITNDASNTSAIDFNNLTGMVNEPRTWGIEASFKF
jgi:iron complex outermembrane recepter protein